MDSVDFYRKNADDFSRRTADLDIEELYRPFLTLVVPGGRILDAGCGSGRDTKAFRARGYDVEAFDASPEMAVLASQLTGIEVHVMRFEEMSYDAEFEGLWCCASLLHVPLAEMHEVFTKCVHALKPGGPGICRSGMAKVRSRETAERSRI